MTRPDAAQRKAIRKAIELYGADVVARSEWWSNRVAKDPVTKKYLDRLDAKTTDGLTSWAGGLKPPAHGAPLVPTTLFGHRYATPAEVQALAAEPEPVKAKAKPDPAPREKVEEKVGTLAEAKAPLTETKADTLPKARRRRVS